MKHEKKSKPTTALMRSSCVSWFELRAGTFAASAVVIGAAVLGVPGCKKTEPEAGANGQKALTARCGDTAKDWVKAGATLVDVRSPDEYNERHLEGAINVPVGDIKSKLADIPEGKVVVYCQSGRRATQAMAELTEAKREVYLLGGISDWESHGCN